MFFFCKECYQFNLLKSINLFHRNDFIKSEKRECLVVTLTSEEDYYKIHGKLEEHKGEATEGQQIFL